MDLTSNVGEHQTKESPVKIIWEHYTTIGYEKHDWFKEEGRSSLPVGELTVAESQRGMTLDKVKFVCHGATPWKMSILLRQRVELFTWGWVSCCWVPKRKDTGNENNDCKTDEENRKGKYKHHVSCNLT